MRDSAYDCDCYFADPTVSFRGLDQWRRNLRLLVPFLEDASVELLAMEPVDRDNDGAQLLKVRALRAPYVAKWLNVSSPAAHSGRRP